ncbi:MAG: DUF6798 domain-containing protein [Caldilineaceae bacterium]
MFAWSLPASFNRRNVAQFLFWALLFDLAFTQWPLYSENQNTKFLIGLAQAHYGNLAQDWLANTIDPLPAFSFLVYFTYRFLYQGLFYVYHALLLGVYLYSVVGIAQTVFPLAASRVGRLYFRIIVIAMHAGLLWPFAIPVMDSSLGWLLQSGVASQYLLNPVFQPSTFGVLLILSIYLFLIDSPVWGAAVAAIAALMHSTYLPSAAVLTAIYASHTLWRTRKLWPAIRVGGAALLIVLPVLIYNYLWLGPTNAELWAASQDVIVNFRIPHHSLPEIWLNNTVYVKLALVLAALILTWRTRLFAVMLVSLLVAVGLTLLQMQAPNDTLAFIAPWRISVFLVPLASTLIIGFAVAWLFKWLQPWADKYWIALGVAGLLLLAIQVRTGVLSMIDSFQDRQQHAAAALWRYVDEHKAPDEVYLAPTYMAEFRLETGAPVVVTFKSHPYKDVEVLEWRSRIDAVNDFYGAMACDKLTLMQQKYGVTHVVLEHGQAVEGCDDLTLEHADDRFDLYRLARLELNSR